MSDNTIPFPQGNRTKNVKADMFEKYMKDEGLNFFRRQETHDSYDTIVFMTARIFLLTHGHKVRPLSSKQVLQRSEKFSEAGENC